MTWNFQSVGTFLEPLCRDYCPEGWYEYLGERFWPEMFITPEPELELWTWFTQLSPLTQALALTATATVIVVPAGVMYMRNRSQRQPKVQPSVEQQPLPQASPAPVTFRAPVAQRNAAAKQVLQVQEDLPRETEVETVKLPLTTLCKGYLKLNPNPSLKPSSANERQRKDSIDQIRKIHGWFTVDEKLKFAEVIICKDESNSHYVEGIDPENPGQPRRFTTAEISAQLKGYEMEGHAETFDRYPSASADQGLRL